MWLESRRNGGAPLEAMAFFVSERFASASNDIQTAFQYIVIGLIPTISMLLLLILAPIFACCCCVGERCACLHKRVIGIAQHIFCFLETKGSHFIVYGYKAPICYTYYLLFVFCIICLHTFLSFWDNALHNSYNYYLDEVYSPTVLNLYCIDIFNITKAPGRPTLNDTKNLKCIEVYLLDGLESAATTFGLSALAVAIMTWVLLTCTKGSRVRKRKTLRVLCVPLIIIFQIFCLYVPRIIFLVYLLHLALINKYLTYDDIFDPPIPAVTDVASLFAVIAILDAVSLTMLTPWLCFEKVDEEETRAVDHVMIQMNRIHEKEETEGIYEIA